MRRRGCESLFLSFRMLREERVEQSLAIVEGRRLQPRESFQQIDQPTLCGKIEHAQRARHDEPLRTCKGSAIAVVHEDQVGIEYVCELVSATATGMPAQKPSRRRSRRSCSKSAAV